jgi:hypothetical protein
MTKFSRRTAILSGLSIPFINSLPALAASPMLGAQTTRFNRFKLGDFEVTALLASTFSMPNAHGIFGTNVSDEEFAAVSAAAHIPTDKAKFFLRRLWLILAANWCCLTRGKTAHQLRLH